MTTPTAATAGGAPQADVLAAAGRVSPRPRLGSAREPGARQFLRPVAAAARWAETVAATGRALAWNCHGGRTVGARWSLLCGADWIGRCGPGDSTWREDVVFGLTVRFEVQPEAVAAFDELVARTVPLIARSEPGTLVYATHRVQGAPQARVFYELYRDRAAFDAHEQQPHVRRFLTEREPLLAAPPRVEFLDLAGGTGVPGAA